MKAITPVIATVMLMLITVGMVGVTYTWFSNMMTTQTEKNIAIPVGGVQCINNRISAIVTNAGANSNITDDDIVVADVNGVNVRNTPFFGGFNTNGLVGYWRFEQSSGSAATNDSSGYGNMGTLTNMNLTGNATSGITQGRFGNALQFDGVDDYVKITDPGASSLDLGKEMTLIMWVNPRGGTSWNRLFEKLSSFSSYLVPSATPVFTLYVSGNYYATYGRSLAFPTNTWTMLTFTYNGSYMAYYYNNNATPQGFNSSMPAGGIISKTDYPLIIGNWYSAGTGNERSFNGMIDEVAIWNRSLSADEITQLNKTNAGNFTLAPNRAITLINGYPVFAKGKYAVRVGTRNGVMERTVECV